MLGAPGSPSPGSATRLRRLSALGSGDANSGERQTAVKQTGLWFVGSLVAASSPLACGAPPDRVVEGAALYRVHCASCHGVAGTGDGPVAPSLTPRPTDLTRIAQRSEGQFRESEVLAAIDGRYEVAAHGPRDMPVWGAVFLEERVGEPLAIHRAMDDARALVDYLRTHGREKVLFGTNYPMILPAKALGGLEELGLPEEVASLFLAGNAKRVFGL